jgi:transcriptional regulator with XRE-family HTH domain
MSNETRYSMQYLRAWREHVGISQETLSKRSGITKATIVRWEKDRHEANGLKANAVAAALGISRDQLVRGGPQNVAPVVTANGRGADGDLNSQPAETA